MASRIYVVSGGVTAGGISGVGGVAVEGSVAEGDSTADDAAHCVDDAVARRLAGRRVAAPKVVSCNSCWFHHQSRKMWFRAIYDVFGQVGLLLWSRSHFVILKLPSRALKNLTQDHLLNIELLIANVVTSIRYPVRTETNFGGQF